MQVCIEVMFGDTDSRHEADVRSMAFGLTDDRASVRVFAQEGDPRWLVAEFTMATEAQCRAVQRIDRSMRFSLWEREDSVIRFPRTAREKKPKRKRS